MRANNGPNRLENGADALEKALHSIRRLVVTDPRSALEKLHALLRGRPDPRALRLAAAAHRKLSETANAHMAELTAIQVSLNDCRLAKAATAQQQGRSLEARSLVQHYLEEEPDDLLALTIAAEAAIALRDFDESDEQLRRILKRAPAFVRASMLLATSLKIRARVVEAIAVLQGVAEREPTNAAALNLLMDCYAEIGRLEDAVATLHRLIDVGPPLPRTWIILAQYLRIIGRSSESKEAFRNALALDPNQGAAWWGLAQFFTSDLSEADIRTIERVTVERAGTANDEGPARIALSIVADRRGDHETAFKHLARGKRLRLENQPYDPGRLSADVDDAIRNLTPELFRSKSGSTDDSPIFIIGMPRSGSTLVERILAQHSRIEGAGELQVLSKIVDPLRHDNGRTRSYNAFVADLSSEGLAAIGGRYVERSFEYRHSSKPKFVDKFNLNWLHSGLIRLVLPNAKILDVRRNALDCCWSNFKMLFADGHANDLTHIAVGSSRVDLQACKLEYSIVSPK